MPQDPIGTILQNEGGFVLNPNDRGLATNFGITQATLRIWLGRTATVDDVRTLDEATARTIYEKEYLYGPGINNLPDPPQVQILDIGVNRGPRVAIMMMQRVVNMAGFGPIDVDGVLGPQRVNAVTVAARQMGPYFNNAIVDARLQFYQQIVAKDASQQVFLQGWTNRAERFRIPLPAAMGISAPKITAPKVKAPRKARRQLNG